MIDFLSTFPFDAVVGGSLAKALSILRGLKLVRLLKLLRILKLNKMAGDYQDLLEINPAVVQLGNLFAAMFFMAHLVSLSALLAS